MLHAGAIPIRSRRGTSNGRPPAPGQIFRNPDLAKTFRILQQQGRDGFYKGEIARAIVAKSTRARRHDDARRPGQLHAASGSTPATTNYHGYDVFTLPPPAQTWATDEILNILEACVPVWAPGQTLATLGPASPKYWHFVVEAKKLAFKRSLRVTTPTRTSRRCRSTGCCRRRTRSRSAARVDPDRASATAPGGNADSGGDTIVLSTADRWGNMVAWVNSLYSSFGSGLTVPGYGIMLHNRGGAVHAGSEEPERDRAAQAAVQHAVGRLRDARTTAR